jgi:hypothetical protein
MFDGVESQGLAVSGAPTIGSLNHRVIGPLGDWVIGPLSHRVIEEASWFFNDPMTQ